MPRSLRVFWKINVLLGALCAVIIAVNRYVLKWGEPYNTPFLPFHHFCDFWNFHDRFEFYHWKIFYSIVAGSVFSYPAPLGLVYKLFFLPHHNQHTIFTIATTLPLFAFLYFLSQEMISRGIRPSQARLFAASTFVFSYPFWFEYLLGNIEICVFLIVAFGIWAWLRGHLYLAAALLGTAGSMKLFPFFYLALFLSRKQYRQFAFGILTAAVLYPFSVWMACPSFSIAWKGIRASSTALGAGLLPNWDWILANVDHSLWCFYKQVVHLLGYSNQRPMWELSVYTAVVAVAGLTLYFFVIRRLRLLNQLISLCVLSVLLPPMSNDYTLLYLYIPWAILIVSTIQDARIGYRRPGVLGAFICFALLFSAESEIIIARAAVGGQFKALTLVVLLYIAFKYPFALPSEQRVTESVEVAVV